MGKTVWSTFIIFIGRISTYEILKDLQIHYVLCMLNFPHNTIYINILFIFSFNFKNLHNTCKINKLKVVFFLINGLKGIKKIVIVLIKSFF